MWRNGFLLILAVTGSFALKAQYGNSISVANNPSFDKVKFSLSATNGQCVIEPGQLLNVLDIHSSADGADEPKYEERIVDRTKEVSIALGSNSSGDLSETISRRMFGAGPNEDKTWKVYLSNLKPLDLDLHYTIGDTYINLSDLHVEKLKMRSGSANVQVNYEKGRGNLAQMDTFLIKVDMGSLEANNLYLCNSSHIITDVGFGKVKMDFKDAEVIRTNVSASVGAGRLEVILPEQSIPVRININDSPLCQIKMPKEFQKVSENVFVTPGFDETIEDGLDFSVDVAIGNIVFK